MRVVVESLAEEFDIVDVAAAAVKIAHDAAGADREEREVPPVPVRTEARSARPPRRDFGAPVTRIFVGAGRRAGISAADLVGAIANEAGLSSRELGAIDITDTFSLVEVPEASADHIVQTLRNTTLRGRRVPVRRDRDTPPR